MDIEEIKLKIIISKELENFIFNSAQKITDEEINLNLKKLEDHLQKVNNYFNFSKLSKKISYYYVNKEIIESYSENSRTTGRANLEKNSVISIYSFHPHEVTHVIIYNNIGRSHPIFMEGIAVLFGWSSKEGVALWKNELIDYWINEYKNNDKLPDIKELIDNFGKINSDISYPVSAFMVRLIVEKIGPDNFQKLFKEIKVGDSYVDFEKKCKDFSIDLVRLLDFLLYKLK